MLISHGVWRKGKFFSALENLFLFLLTTPMADVNEAVSRRDEAPPPLSSPTSFLSSVNTLFVWDFDWRIVNCNSDE